MGPGILWNLSEYIRRLGGLRGDFPPVVNSIQPVLLAGDASGLTTPFLSPMAWFGSLAPAVVAEFAAVIISSRAAGGTFVREVSATGAGAGSATTFKFFVGNAGDSGAGVFTATQTPPAQNMGPEPVKAIVQTGTSDTAMSVNTRPQMWGGVSETVRIIDGFYIPPGEELIVQRTIPNLFMVFNVLVQEVNVSIPKAS